MLVFILLALYPIDKDTYKSNCLEVDVNHIQNSVYGCFLYWKCREMA